MNRAAAAPDLGTVTGNLPCRAAHMTFMRTITQRSDILELSVVTIIFDESGPMQVIDPNLLGVLGADIASSHHLRPGRRRAAQGVLGADELISLINTPRPSPDFTVALHSGAYLCASPKHSPTAGTARPVLPEYHEPPPSPFDRSAGSPPKTFKASSQ